MPLTYTDVIMAEFGEREFTARELAFLTGSSRAAKVLSELKRRGVVRRVDRGRYRVLLPSERPDLRSTLWSEVRAAVLEGPGPMAWTGATAVEVWTHGGYVFSPNPFRRVFHVEVPRRNLNAWRRHLRRRGISSNVDRPIGAAVELVPVPTVHPVRVAGEPVISRREVLEVIRAHPGIYADAGRRLVKRPD